MQVTAKSNIKHNGELFTAGQTLDVTENQAADLLAAGSIEPVKGLKPTEPEDPRNIPSDKTLQQKGTDETANLPIAITMKKTQLIGIARANGLEVEKTATAQEVYKLIKEHREKSGTKIDAVKKEDEDEANKGDVTGSEDTTTPGAKPEGDNPEFQNTNGEVIAQGDATPASNASKSK